MSDQARYVIRQHPTEVSGPLYLGGHGLMLGDPAKARKFSHAADALAWLESNPVPDAVAWDLRTNQPVETEG